jgi:cytochrome c556
VFTTFEDTAAKMPALFPANSKEGGDTTAAPKIWEAKADFDAKFAKFGADSKAAAAKVTDLDSMKTAFGDVAKNCGGCHNDYRVKK